MLTDRIYAVYDRTAESQGLPDLMQTLVNQQRRTWPLLGSGYEALGGIKLRELRSPGYSVLLQFNPGRIVSSDAKVDDASIRARRCFLCVDNLPEEQRGILYRDDFLILCNPAPIFYGHFTISHVEHVPQQIRPSLGVFLELAKEMEGRYTVFYNGPKCGASAPDHMHFQASPSGSIPVEREALRSERRQVIARIGGTTVVLLEDLGREIVILEGGDASMVIELVHRILESLESRAGHAEEPMVNILVSYSEGQWRMTIFPRRKHRPDVYFREGPEKILVSPAAVDMGGLVITPVEKDFTRLTAETVDGIFHEVSLGREAVVETLLSVV